MGEYLFITLFSTLFLLVGVDIFVRWYRIFLVRRRLPGHIRRAIEQVMWVLLALLCCNLLYRKFLPDQFDTSHLLFALFIFSLRGLLVSLMEQR